MFTGTLTRQMLQAAGDPGEPPVSDPAETDPCMIMDIPETTGNPKGALWTDGQTVCFAVIESLYWRQYAHLGDPA